MKIKFTQLFFLAFYKITIIINVLLQLLLLLFNLFRGIAIFTKIVYKKKINMINVHNKYEVEYF